MQNELLATLTKFHRDVLLPDVKREVGKLRDEMVARFDGIESSAGTKWGSDVLVRFCVASARRRSERRE